jgi:hypothetical protein
MNKSEISAAAIHAIGCDMDDWLENSRRSEHELAGRAAAFKEMERDVPAILSQQEIDENPGLVAKMAKYMASQRGAAQDRHSFQRGFGMALERVVAHLNKKHAQALANAQNPNLHAHPDEKPGTKEIRSGSRRSPAKKETAKKTGSKKKSASGARGKKQAKGNNSK